MATIDEANAAAARLEAATTALEAALATALAAGAGPDLQPLTDGLNNAATQAENALNPVVPAG